MIQTRTTAEAVADPPLQERLSLKHNFSWTLVGQVLYAVCQWGMLSVLAKLGSPVMVGVFSLAMAITLPVIMFANLSLRFIQATDARQEYRFSDYLGLRLLALSLVIPVVAVISLAMHLSRTGLLVVAMMTFAKITDSVSDIIYGLVQQRERMDRISISRIIVGILQLVTLSIAIKLTHNIVFATLAMAVASAITMATYDFKSALLMLGNEVGGRFRALTPRFHKETLVKLTRLAFPMGIFAVLDSVNNSIPRFFLNKHAGDAAVGYFSALAYLMMAGGVIVSALANSATPRLSQNYISNLAAFRKLVGRLVLIAIVIGGACLLASMVCGKLLLTILYKASYATHVHTFQWLMFGAGIWYIATFLSGALTAARQLDAQAPLMIVTVLTTTVACFFLVPHYGLDGAAWAFCSGMTVRLIGSIAILRRAVQTSPAAA